jgi:hypothetical protein
MLPRSGVDSQHRSHGFVELKSAPRPTPSAPSVWLHSIVPSRARWVHLLPLACLLIVGASVPGFLVTLAILLVSVVIALGVFIFLIQLPVGYLVSYWRDLRRGRAAKRPTPRRAPSNGI